VSGPQRVTVDIVSLDLPFLIIGHRGAAGLEPENTLRSFSRAVRLGVDAVELDVHWVYGELIVIHDDTLERTTNGSGSLDSISLAELRELDAGAGERIPTLTESLDLLLADCAVNIELKGPGTAIPVARLLTQRFADSKVLVSSFMLTELRAFHAACPEVNVAPLFGRRAPDLARLEASLSPWSVNLSRRNADAALIRSIRDAGYRCLVYTVNEPDELATLLEHGASGVFTDFPDRIRRPSDASC
jgi:glycerophosphoryl diester phosphodiesterase